jgi:hypothetical protein
MSATYELWLLNHATDSPIQLVSDYSAFAYAKVVNGIGSWSMSLPQSFDIRQVQRDTRIAVHRRLQDGPRTLDFVGLVRYIEKSQRGNSIYYTIAGPDLNDFLRRRIIPYGTSSTTYAKKATYADNMMKAFVTQNLGASAGTNRAITSYGFSVEADESLCTSVLSNAAWKNLYEVLVEIANSSQSTPATAAYFGIVPLGTGWTCQFRTNKQQWGVDRRYPTGGSGVVILSLDFANVGDITRNWNYREEVNYVWCGYGTGTGTAKKTKQASDAARIGQSPFNQCEGFTTSNSSSSSTVTSVANAAVRAGRPRQLFSASIINTANAVYGREFGFGDYVTAVFQGEQVNCRVNAVEIRLNDKDEEVNIRLGEEW